MLAARRGALQRITGKVELTESEGNLVRTLMEECINDAISGYLYSLDNPDDSAHKIRIYVDDVLVNGRNWLQPLLYGDEGWLEKYGGSSGMNSRNFLDDQTKSDI